MKGWTILMACLWAVSDAHPQPQHLTQPLLLFVQGVPVQLQGSQGYYLARDYANSHDTSGVPGVIEPNNHIDNDLFKLQSDAEDNRRKKRDSTFSYTAPGGTSRTEKVSSYQHPRVKDPLTRVTGQVSWTSPEGIPFSLRYVADGTGYHPEGDHLPDSPHYRQFFVGRTEA